MTFAPFLAEGPVILSRDRGAIFPLRIGAVQSVRRKGGLWHCVLGRT